MASSSLLLVRERGGFLAVGQVRPCRQRVRVFSLSGFLSASRSVCCLCPSPCVCRMNDDHSSFYRPGQPVGGSDLALMKDVPSCNEYGTIYAISIDFGDRMTMQSMGLIV